MNIRPWRRSGERVTGQIIIRHRHPSLPSLWFALVASPVCSLACCFSCCSCLPLTSAFRRSRSACVRLASAGFSFVILARSPVLHLGELHFVFSVKVPQNITHDKVLADCDLEWKEFLDTIGILRQKLGPIVFQFPYFIVTRTGPPG
jgi:hypothetical protein